MVCHVVLLLLYMDIRVGPSKRPRVAESSSSSSSKKK